MATHIIEALGVERGHAQVWMEFGSCQVVMAHPADCPELRRQRDGIAENLEAARRRVFGEDD